MYEKSKLLEDLLAACRQQGKKFISASAFVAEVLKVLANKDSYRGDRDELDELENLFWRYDIDFTEASMKIYAALESRTEDFMDSYLLSRILKDFELRYMSTGSNCVVTAVDVCRDILNNPTEVVREVIESGRIDSGLSDHLTGHDNLSNSSDRAQGGSDTNDDDNTYNTDNTDDDDDNSDDELAAIRRLFIKDEDYDEFGGDSGPEEETGESGRNGAPVKEGELAKIVKKANALRDVLSAKIYGQDHAISEFISGYFRAELSAVTDEHRRKPKATFLFAGPPGVGKTYLSEQAAKALKLPFMRFDMSEYADKEAHFSFCGSDKVYKNSGPGTVTGFVAENPECVLLFDEVEKCHLVVIHLFLQMLDAGRLRDNFTNEEVSFKDAIIIFTTNAGKQMYDDESINLLTVSRKSILRALTTDINPLTNSPLFPPAIGSRFASGSVIMFNRMGASNLLKISEGEMAKQFRGIEAATGVKIGYDSMLPCALLYAEGGKADARTIKGKSGGFVFNEIYELLRLINSKGEIDALKSVNFELQMPSDAKTAALFKSERTAEILLFADDDVCSKCVKLVEGVVVHCASTVEEAKVILDKGGITLILCDITCGTAAQSDVLNIEDVDSEGRNFFGFVTEMTSVPVYILESENRKISREEQLSMSRGGAVGVISMDGEKPLKDAVSEEVDKAYRQKKLTELARANKVLNYKTLQYFLKESGEAKIVLFDFRIVTAVDAEDAENVINGVSRPDMHFDDVIGAKDAKDELSYFVEYLKNPSEYVRHGVKAPKGILLYGPPGTGKTMLAKAMAGESDVTFISAEGNQFLKHLVGEGPESVHALFRTARKYAPAILFIDEIDAIAKERGSTLSAESSSDVLTSFLTEMDGFKTDKERPVFVLAATNYDVEGGDGRSLDPALLRRFDRRIFVGLPNREERTLFIKRKLARALNQSVSEGQIDNLAVRSTGSSLADLDSVIELALRNVIKSKGYTLTDEILEEAFETFTSGEIKKWDSAELERTARHEAGHALVCRYCGEKPTYLTIVARGNHGGYMQHADTEDKGMFTKKELMERIMTSLGGRAAEVVYYGDDGLSTGASGDLRTATSIARAMICSYGMDEETGLGTISSDDLKGQAGVMVMGRVNAILKEQFAAAVLVINNNKHILDRLTEILLEKNSLKEEELEEILKEVK